MAAAVRLVGFLNRVRAYALQTRTVNKGPSMDQ